MRQQVDAGARPGPRRIAELKGYGDELRRATTPLRPSSTGQHANYPVHRRSPPRGPRWLWCPRISDRLVPIAPSTHWADPPSPGAQPPRAARWRTASTSAASTPPTTVFTVRKVWLTPNREGHRGARYPSNVDDQTRLNRPPA